MIHHHVADAYLPLSERYIELFASVDSVDSDDLRLIGDHLGGLTGPVLDLGCGPGHLSGFLNETGSGVTGIDLVPEFIAHARRAYPSVQFELRSMTELARPYSSVAGVLAWFSLIHVDPADLDDVLAEIRRVLARGSALVVAFFEGARYEPFSHRVITAYRWPADELAQRLMRAGLHEVKRVHGPAQGDQRSYAAIAARADSTWLT